MTTSSRAGAKFETDVVQYIRGQDLIAERLPKAGKYDEGDVVLGPWSHMPVVMETKVRRDRTTGLSLGTFVGEAVKEASHYQSARDLRADVVPVAVLKKVQGSIGEAFVVIRLADFLRVWNAGKSHYSIRPDIRDAADVSNLDLDRNGMVAGRSGEERQA